MNYVKYFDILGVNTAQIPCIELQGVPNTATEGAVGLLGINMLSEEHELYKCVEVKGNVYTWMPIKNGKDGVSVVKAELNDNGELIITFSNGTETNLGVIKGEKGEKGEQADLTKIKEKNEGKHISVWSGSTEKFEKLENTEENTFYLLEDDTTLDEIDEALTYAETKISEFDATVKGLEVRTKALEDITPVVEDEISALENKTTSLTDEVNKIKNGDTTVPKAVYSQHTTEATYAYYAGPDTSKGTIEERLTNLGFKEGSFIPYINSGTAQATKNHITKKGKYVIANLEISSNANFTIGVSVPAEFRPKEDVSITVITNLYYAVILTLGTDGVLKGATDLTPTHLQIINAGWEIVDNN